MKYQEMETNKLLESMTSTDIEEYIMKCIDSMNAILDEAEKRENVENRASNIPTV